VPPQTAAASSSNSPKVNVSVVIGVECSKNVFGKFRRVSVREKVVVDFLEFLHGQEARWTILEKALVPFLYFVLAKVG
jgi:hypothetical protein